MINRRTLAAQLAALPLAGLFGAAAPPPNKPVVGELAPEFTLKMVDGSIVKLSELRGRVVLLNFWATWCAPCVKELPLLDAYYGVAKKDGLSVYAITTEGSAPIHKLKPLFARLRIPSARSIRGPYRPIDGAVPSNFVIDHAGILRYAKAGAFDLDGLNRVVIPLLNQRVSAATESTRERGHAG